ncbi:MAG: citryl-CoA lyase [Actinomycetota bacterium]|nr:citryl-CoA lyase [Actinomycetota bacterium]
MSTDRAFWRTAISSVRPNEIRVRGYDLIELIGSRPFGDVVYLLLSTDLPKGNEGRMIDALLVAACEHSVLAPSVNAARFVASAGVPLQAAVAAGTMGLGDYHGGAVESGADMLLEAEQTQKPPMEAAMHVAWNYKENGQRLPGYGHVVHDPDPRGRKLLKVAQELGFANRYIELAKAFETVSKEVFGRNLAMNVDGAMAAILLELGLDPGLGKALYVIGRAPGLVAHVFEEQTRERPYRDIGWRNVRYEGPDPRKLR